MKRSIILELVIVATIILSQSVNGQVANILNENGLGTDILYYPGWNIYDQGAASIYRYGPSIIINPDKSIDMWVASPGEGSSWDCIRHRKSVDEGRSWAEQVVLTPTSSSIDNHSVCDPGVVYFNGYYYVAYTTTTNSNGTQNFICVARFRTPTGAWEKWNGSGWGGNPQPIINYTGNPSYWGIGEPSFVILGDVLYIYYSYTAEVNQTRVATASISDPNWPRNITYKGVAINRGPGEQSTDIKYIDGLNKFIGVAEQNRLTANSKIVFYTSNDGLTFQLSHSITNGIHPYAHNSGISGRSNGHLNLSDKNFISYAYGPNWANWKTALTPISFGPVGCKWCAPEGGSFILPGICDIAYGANGQFHYKHNQTGNITFSNASFGDPIFGVVKAGFYKTAGTSVTVQSISTNITQQDQAGNYLCYNDEYEVYANGVSGANNVLFPTWTNLNGQDDIIWIQGVYEAAHNRWKAVIRRSSHNSEYGLYATHIYGINGAGEQKFLGEVKAVLDKSASISATMACDNGYEFYLNGIQIGSGNNWQQSQTYSNLNLQSGKNVVAVKAIDAGGIASFLAEMTIDGQRIGTNSSWKVSTSAPSGWNAVNYNDNSWVNATVYGNYGVSPWGKRVNGMPNDTPAKWIWSSDANNHNAVYFRYEINTGGTPTNIASDKPTSQSSTAFDIGTSAKAVDGNTNGNWDWNNNSVTHTSYEAQPWWKVNLGGSYSVDSVILWNRTDNGCGERLSNFHVDYLNQNGAVIAKKDYPRTAGARTVIDMPVSGVYAIRVQLYGTNYLSLAEVEIFGFKDENISIGKSIEIANITTKQANSSSWNSVSFENSFNQVPIVVIGPLSTNGADKSTIRVRNITKEGFDFQIDEWDYRDGAHTNETITYLAVEPGTHQYGNLQILAEKVTGVNHNWKSVNYNDNFSTTPVVITQQVSNNDNSATVVRLKGITNTKFDLRVQNEQNNDGVHGNEEICYVAISKGNGIIGSYSVKADVTTNSVAHDWYQIDFEDNFSNPGLLATIQTCDGPDPVTLRYTNLNSISVKVMCEGEQSKDDEVTHTTEVVGWLLVAKNQKILSSDNASNGEDVLPKEFNLYQNYPNPFNPETTIRFTLPQSEKVKFLILNVKGEVVDILANTKFEAGKHEVKFDGRSLNSGMYFYQIKAGKHTSTKRMILVK